MTEDTQEGTLGARGRCVERGRVCDRSSGALGCGERHDVVVVCRRFGGYFVEMEINGSYTSRGGDCNAGARIAGQEE